MRRTGGLAVLVALAPFLLAACGLLSTAATPQPAGRYPSPIAQEVCGEKAASEIADVLGLSAHVSRPTWVGHLYSCDYEYGKATMVLSVKELSSWPQTYAYYNGLGRALHLQQQIVSLGQGAFEAGNGSVVVRKDWKVLLVDVHGLPGSFGNPPSPVGNVALSVAGVILGCWHGD
ncbi:MAG TPA: hypothetical protein VME46_10630 [Acidimicrobiales bacterium]|nr:hypothetical protein [Acidimicrobiales bacterium]